MHDNVPRKIRDGHRKSRETGGKMRILVVGRYAKVVMDDLIQGMNPQSIERVVHHAYRLETKDGTIFDAKALRTVNDLESIRGVRYDMILEHASFGREIRDLDLLHQVRAMVLR